MTMERLAMLAELREWERSRRTAQAALAPLEAEAVKVRESGAVLSLQLCQQMEQTRTQLRMATARSTQVAHRIARLDAEEAAAGVGVN
jgi:hypothetical protein